VEAAAVTPVRVALRVRALSLSVPVALALLVGTSTLVRFVLSLAHPTPLFFADEYIYSTLAHELATTGRPTIRGEAASFPALLQPILTAPFWLFDNAGVALRLTQGLNALAMSLAAVPAYLLARKVSLGSGLALAVAVLTVLVPDLFYVAYILAEPIAYPLVIGAVYAAVCALSRPTRSNQLAFVLLAGLASFARIQFVVLPLAFLGAALLARTGFRRLRLTLGLFVLAAVPVAVKGLGYYSGVGEFSLDPSQIVRWFGVDAMLLAYAAGWLVIPGALVALATPRGTAERAFAGFTVVLAFALFVEAALYATNQDDAGGRFQERYLFTLVPLIVIAFGLSLRREGRTRLVIAALGALLVAVSARFPLSGWTDRHGRQDSPFLMGVYKLEEAIGYANGSLLVAVVVAALAAGAVAIAFRPSLAVGGLAAVALCLALVAGSAWSLDKRSAQNARATYFPADARWVDHANLGDVTIVNTPGSRRELTLEQMFWNRSIKRLARLERAGLPDVFAAPELRVGDDGSLFLEGKRFTGALLINEYAVMVDLHGARSVAASSLFELWKPAGAPRLRLFAGGRYYDRWLANTGYVRVWDEPGMLRLRLTLPRVAEQPSRLVFTAGGSRRVVVVRPGGTKRVAFRVPPGVWTLRWEGTLFYLRDRPVSVRADELSLVSGGSRAGSPVPIAER
jgi:hypothetical protein